MNLISLTFIDIVSKNGNLLINVGPKADGTIPELQKKILLKLGNWLDDNHEAIFSTRPWKYVESSIEEGLSVRFTQKDGSLYIVTLGFPQNKDIQMKIKDFQTISDVKLLGFDGNLDWSNTNNHDNDNILIISLPPNLKESPALSFKIIP
ncbi:MAG: hypothetical protein GF317_18120 [Candidatus Lokiarchaeota archaeon]|nr:hypothetical protein [Candidatus Lokiarchaeota archaeon]MBD3201430.1 hypothetical protein [Candidatus Lokiarchaeota archaeon]